MLTFLKLAFCLKILKKKKPEVFLGHKIRVLNNARHIKVPNYQVNKLEASFELRQ